MLSSVSLPWTGVRGIFIQEEPSDAAGELGGQVCGTQTRGSVNICLASGENQAAVNAFSSLIHFPSCYRLWAFSHSHPLLGVCFSISAFT